MVNKRFNEKVSKSEQKKESKIKWKNEWRIEKGKPALKPKYKRTPGFIFDAYLSYSSGNLNGINTSQMPTLTYNIERLNLDLAVYLILKKRISFAYNFRIAAINFKNVNLNNPSNIILQTLDFVDTKDPFVALESNFKLNYHTKYLDLYFKINDVFGSNLNPFIEARYHTIVYNTSFVTGFTINIDTIINR